MRILFKPLTIRLVLAAYMALVPVGCAMETGDQDESTEVGLRAEALDAPHVTMIRECSYAMTGNATMYNETNWPTAATTFATSPYTTNVLSAWNAMIASPSYAGSGINGWYVSCRKTSSQGILYPPCYLTSGMLDMPYTYTCQGSCPGAMRGGQCRAFTNLLAFHSGLYTAGGSFKSFPSDAIVAAGSTATGWYPWATFANIVEGDILRNTSGKHSLVVVRKIAASQTVVVFDSNWIGGGNGAETVGSHVLGFSGSGINNLANYRVMQCVYSGNC